MASRSAQIMTETDGPGDGTDALSNLPPPNNPVDIRSNTRAPAADADPEFEVIETDSDLNPIAPGAPVAPPAAPPAADEPPSDGSLSEDDEQDRAADAAGRPREDRASRRRRQREGRNRTLEENARLRAEVERLSGQVSGIEPRLNEIDQQRHQETLQNMEREIQAAATEATAARKRLSEAMANNDGEAFAAALEARDNAIMKGQQMTVRRNILATGNAGGDPAIGDQRRPNATPPAARQPSGGIPPAQRPLSQRALEYVQDFKDQHAWFNPSDPSDLDSQLTAQLDSSVRRDGYDPGTQDYWDELNDRLARYIPHRFSEDRMTDDPPARNRRQPPAARNNAAPPARNPSATQQPPQRRGPAVGAPSDRSPTPAANQVYMSPERKEALILAGALANDGRTVQDRGKYNRLLKSYSEFDRANGVGRQ